MKRKILIILLLVFLVIMSLPAYSWMGETHKKITNQVAIQYDLLDNYLKSLGFPGGDEETFFPLSWGGSYYVPPEIQDVKKHIKNDTQSALTWLIDGSYLEDGKYETIAGRVVPTSARARHHFHDPTTLNGLGPRVAPTAY